jgi:hypothetical protein
MNSSDDWASLASEIGADFEDEGGQMSVGSATKMLQRGMRALMAEEAKRHAPPPIEFPEFDVSDVADAVRGNQASFAALVRAVQALKLNVSQAGPNITMPKIEVPAAKINVDFPAPVINIEMPRSKGWRFEFERSKDGLVECIRAIPE